MMKCFCNWKNYSQKSLHVATHSNLCRENIEVVRKCIFVCKIISNVSKLLVHYSKKIILIDKYKLLSEIFGKNAIVWIVWIFFCVKNVSLIKYKFPEMFSTIISC